MNRNRLFLYALMGALGCLAQMAMAADSIAVVVSLKSPVQKLTLPEVKALFLSETRYAAPDVAVAVNDRDRDSEIYRVFYTSIASMSPRDVSVHKAKKVFTGEAAPTLTIKGDDAAAKAVLLTNPKAITYILEKNAGHDVRIVFSLQKDLANSK